MLQWYMTIPSKLGQTCHVAACCPLMLPWYVSPCFVSKRITQLPFAFEVMAWSWWGTAQHSSATRRGRLRLWVGDFEGFSSYLWDVVEKATIFNINLRDLYKRLSILTPCQEWAAWLQAEKQVVPWTRNLRGSTCQKYVCRILWCDLRKGSCMTCCNSFFACKSLRGAGREFRNISSAQPPTDFQNAIVGCLQRL